MCVLSLVLQYIYVMSRPGNLPHLMYYPSALCALACCRRARYHYLQVFTAGAIARLQELLSA